MPLQQGRARLFYEPDRLFATDRGEVIQELIQRYACREVIREAADGDAGAHEDGFAAHDLGVDVDERFGLARHMGSIRRAASPEVGDGCIVRYWAIHPASGGFGRSNRKIVESEVAPWQFLLMRIRA